MSALSESTSGQGAPLARVTAKECVGWVLGFLMTAAIVAAALWLRESEHMAPIVWGSQQALLVIVVGVLLFGMKEPGPMRCSLAAGAAAGVLVGVALAQRAPTAWFMRDVAWHTAKVALTASGQPFDDPILRIPTIYPFGFSVLVGTPVALGLSLKSAMWATTSLSLAGTLGSYWFLARAFLKPSRAAWTAVALPLVFYAPMNGYWLLPNPFNASMPFVFAGLALIALGTPGVCTKKLPLGGALLGLAGLLWYGHLLWIVPFALVWGWQRWRALKKLLLGAALPALVLLVHVAWVARAGNLVSSGITSSEPLETSERLGAMLRNLVTLSGDAALADGPWWVGALFLPAVVLAVVRRPAGGVDGARIVRAMAPFLVLCIVYAGLRMTYWRPFSWRYTFVLYSVLLLIVGAGPAVSLAGRRVGLVAVVGLAGLLSAPLMARRAVWWSIQVAQTHETEVLPLAAEVERLTERDEPVLASAETWERTLACAAQRPTLVDRNGGTYKYAPASVAGPRWQVAEMLRTSGDRESLLTALEPYGFRYAIVSTRDRAQPGYAALAMGFELVYEGAPYVIVDLTKPR